MSDTENVLATLDVDEINDSQAALKTQCEELLTTQATLHETVDKLNNDMISKAEFAERVDRIGKDLQEMSDSLEVVRNASTVKSERFIYNDYRALLSGKDWLAHDDRTPFSDVECRGYVLFQMPVDYEKMDHGQELKNLRDLHDAFLLTNAFNTYKGKANYKIETSTMYKQLRKSVEFFDPTLAHAMAGGNSGYGTEWVPVETSAQFNEIARIQPTLSNRFQTWIMPTGASAYFPFQEGKATVYKGGEALVDNPTQARKTNIATGRKLFTPSVFIGALKASEELTEDSIIEMVGFIRRELAVAILDGLDSAIINGDTGGTHIDHAVGAGLYWQTYGVQTCFDGLRKICVTDSTTFDHESWSSGTGVGSFEMDGAMHAKQLLGLLGLRNNECVFVTGAKGGAELMTMWATEDFTGNTLSMMISGVMPNIHGSPVHLSGEYMEDQESDGFGDTGSATEKHTSMCCVHTPSFRVGQRRGVTIEMDKDILTQQQAFVATARYDFGKVCSSTLTPVSCAINMQHTD